MGSCPDTDQFYSINLLNPERDQYLISPYSNTAESFIKITRVKEMIDCQLIKEALIAREILLVSTKGNV